MSFQRIHTVESYMGDTSSMPELRAGDTYFATDTSKFYIVNHEQEFVEVSGAGGGGGGGGDDSVVDFRVPLTNEQMKNMGDNEVIVIPSPGEGKYIKMISIDVLFLNGETEWEDEYFYMGYESEYDEFEFYNGAGPNSTRLECADVGDDFRMYMNEAIMLSTDGDNYSVGDGTMEIIGRYRVIEI